MLETKSSHIGKVVYVMLGVAVLAFTFNRYDPNSDLGDIAFVEMALMMGALSFPVSIAAVPLALGAGLLASGVMSVLAWAVPAISYSVSIKAFVFTVWLFTFGSGYVQWFWFPHWYDKRRGGAGA